MVADKPVSPLLYGNFIEMGFGRCENLWAEMLYNRSFEEDEPFTPDWVKFTKPQKEMEDWWHSGYEQQPWYLKKSASDTLSSFKKIRGYWPACHSMTNISLSNGSKTDPIYYAQDGMYLKKYMSYRFSGYFCCSGFGNVISTENPVEVVIGLYREGDFSKPVSEKTMLVHTNSFGRYDVEFDPMYDGRATLAIKLPAGKKIGLDFLSLMPSDNVKGWRKDAIDLIKTRVPVPVLRFPGGCYASFYNWRDGIGDQYYRPVNLTSFWTSPVINDFGTIEFVEFCREINSEPMLCVPMMFKPIENTLDWISFCNAPENELRKKYGHPEPLEVKYWELENEMYRTMDAITYANKCVEYSKAMKAIDPDIKTIMGDYWIFNPKLKEMLEIAGQYIDIVNNRGGNIAQQTADMEIIREYNKTHKTHITMCHSEFRAPLTRARTGADGLNRVERRGRNSLQNMSTHWAFAMSVLDQFIQFQKFGGDYSFLNFTSLNDTWGENLINLAKEGAFLSSAGKAFEFINKVPVAWPLTFDVTNPDENVVFQAAWNRDHTKLSLIALNFSGLDKQSNFDLNQLKTSFLPEQKHLVVFAANDQDFNSPLDLNKIKTIEDKSTFRKNAFTISMKPYSANAWIFDVKQKN
jgi:alpha-N-arabinofuranosidase